MSVALLDRLEALRRAPTEPSALEDLLAGVRAVAGRWCDDDDVLQEVLLRVWRRWPDCRAGSEASARAWIRTTAWRARLARLPRGDSEGPDPDELGGASDVEEECRRRALGVALRVVEDAAHRDPRALPPRHRARARAARVGRDRAAVARNAQILEAHRIEGSSAEAVGARLGLTAAAIRAAAVRGAAAVALEARIQSETEPDPWVRGALLEIARRAA